MYNFDIYFVYLCIIFNSFCWGLNKCFNLARPVANPNYICIVGYYILGECCTQQAYTLLR